MAIRSQSYCVLFHFDGHVEVARSPRRSKRPKSELRDYSTKKACRDGPSGVSRTASSFTETDVLRSLDPSAQSDKSELRDCSKQEGLSGWPIRSESYCVLNTETDV